MILDKGTDADLLIEGSEFFELGFDLAYLLANRRVRFPNYESQAVELNAELLRRAQNLFGMGRASARDRGRQQRQLQAVLPEGGGVLRQLGSNALRQDLAAGPHRAVYR